jgi:predicted DNA-binding transcriptional regulator AlpA
MSETPSAQSFGSIEAANDEFIKVAKVAKRYDSSEQTIWRWSREGRIPKPVKIGPGTSRWSLRALIESEAAK